MIDFHTHILPNIDDGARNIEETYNLLKEAQQAGFEGVVLTSHYSEGYYETNCLERDTWLNVILNNIDKEGIKTNIYSGNEIYINNNILPLLEEGKASTMNDSCYVLFEMPLDNEPLNLYDVIYTLQENKLIPVLAHPERYSFIQKEPELVYDLVQKGCLMQANYGSILGQYGSKAKFIVEKFLENNLIHFLGSDVHRQKTIYSKIPEAIENIREIVGDEKIEKLTTINPKLALANKKIEIDFPREVTLDFKDKIKLFFKK